MSSAVQPLPLSPEEEARIRAERIGAMLDRWAKEDVAKEPDWDIANIGPLKMRNVPNGNASPNGESAPL